MSKDPFETGPETGDGAAINQVLAAERAAQQTVSRCERQARDLLRDAQDKVRRIQQRCDERIRLIHEHCSRRLAESAGRSGAFGAAESPAAEVPGGDRLAAAIERLAAELSGAEGGGE